MSDIKPDASERADQIEEAVNGLEAPNFLKAAALALADQPFGFTRLDVDALRDAVEQYRDSAEGRDGLFSRTLDSLASRIEALLPPEA